MSAFPFKDFSGSVLLFIFVVCVESQDFCESYQRNNYSMIVFSHSYDTLLLIVDKHFWRLREKDMELVYDRKDYQASNSSEQWAKRNYTFANAVYDLNDTNYRGIALFKDQNNITKAKDENGILVDVQNFWYDYYQFYGNYFLYANQTNETSFKTFHEKRFSFSVPEKNIDSEAIQTFNLTTKQFQRFSNMRKHIRISKPVQTFKETRPDSTSFTLISIIDVKLIKFQNFQNQTLKQFARSWDLRQFLRRLVYGSFEYIDNYNELGPKFREIFNRTKDIYLQVDRLYNFTNIPMIGTYLSSKNQIICFFRINDDIKYCTIDQCIRDEYKILISCGKTKFLSNIWFLLAICVVTIVVFVTVAAFVIYLMKRTKKVKYELQSASSVNTINSETGLPLHPSKSRSSGKKVSPEKRLQTPTKPEKPKVETKPKKSPKTKE